MRKTTKLDDILYRQLDLYALEGGDMAIQPIKVEVQIAPNQSSSIIDTSFYVKQPGVGFTFLEKISYTGGTDLDENLTDDLDTALPDNAEVVE